MRRLHRPFLTFLSFFASLGTRALAQEPVVAGVLTEAATSRSVAGAAVYLLNDHAAAVAAVLSDDQGAFRLRAPGPGVYRLRVERIGFESEVSPPLAVGIEGSSDASMSLRVQPIELDPLEVRSGRVCNVDRDASEELSGVWWEARKALSATVLSGDRRREAYVVEVAERELDRDLKVKTERADTLRVDGVHVFGFVPIEELEVTGWGILEDGAVARYFGPSPEVLLSGWFGRTHCFTRTEPDEGGGRVGLRFESIRDSLAVGMAGVFWLDASSWRLLEIDFRFTGPRELERAKHQGGSVVLDVDDSGTWYVTRWHMRRPVLRRGPLVWERSAGGRRSATRRYTVVGYVERTGRLLGAAPGGS